MSSHLPRHTNACKAILCNKRFRSIFQERDDSSYLPQNYGISQHWKAGPAYCFCKLDAHSLGTYRG